MKLNMGTADRSIRLVAAAIIAVLYFSGKITGIVAVVLGVVAVIFLVTSLTGYCPGYVPFGISTRKANQKMPPRPGAAA